LREGVGERRKRGGGVADHSDGFAGVRPVRQKTAGQFGEAGKTVRDSFDDAERDGRCAEARNERGEKRSRGFVPPVGEEAGEADSHYARREPT